MTASNKVFVAGEICKGCNLCVISCPQHLISLTSYFNGKGYTPARWDDPEEKCKCSMPLCYLMCPDVAIEVRRENPDTTINAQGEENNG